MIVRYEIDDDNNDYEIMVTKLMMMMMVVMGEIMDAMMVIGIEYNDDDDIWTRN
jgi:hypothetical protein